MTSFPVIDGTKTLWGAVDDDFNIKTTRTDPGTDADIEILAADDLRLIALGDDAEIYANNSVKIYTNWPYNEAPVDAHEWAFGVDGNLTIPGDIRSATTTGPVAIQSNDGNNTYTWNFGTNGSLTFPDTTIQTTAYKRTTGSWTVATGSDTYSFTVPLNGTYSMWVKGTIDNGIIAWNATATVTNNNVPVIGQQFAWNYTGGGTPIEITAIPTQFIGTANTIVSSNPGSIGSTTNTFDFVINNTSGAEKTVYWGYVTQ